MIGIIGRLRVYVDFFALVHALICSFRNMVAAQLLGRMICPASQRLLHHNGKETMYGTLLSHMNRGPSSQSIDLAIMSTLSIQVKRGPRIPSHLIKSKSPPAL